MLIISVFTTVIYQPFFNLLVFIYWLLGFGSAQPDMGMAVIILTVIIRILLLPMSLAGSDSEKERREISAKMIELERNFGDDPIKLKSEQKKMMKKSRHIVWGEVVSLFVQVSIALMLWKIFETGLPGGDLHLIYPFMPQVDLPFNLMFLNKIDLSATSFRLNLLQSILIFILESLSVLTSPFPHSRAEVIRLQFTLPVLSFLIFIFMPAGKKLFVITTLIFSIILTLFKFVKRKFYVYKEKKSQPQPPEEKVVVTVK